MLTLTESQMMGWVLPLLWPFLRALALLSALPVLGQRNVPMRVRIGLAAFIALGVAWFWLSSDRARAVAFFARLRGASEQA